MAGPCTALTGSDEPSRGVASSVASVVLWLPHRCGEAGMEPAGNLWCIVGRRRGRMSAVCKVLCGGMRANRVPCTQMQYSRAGGRTAFLWSITCTFKRFSVDLLNEG